MPRRLTQEEAEQRFEARGLRLLCRYQGNHKSVKIRCRCGKSFEALPGHVFSGHTSSCGCYNKMRVSETKRLTQKEVEKRFRERNLECLSQYAGSRKRVEVRCHCGEVFVAYAGDVFAGDTVSCGCLQNVDQEEASRRFSERGLVLLTQYKSTRTRAKARCKCGEMFWTWPSNVFQGKTTSCGCARRLSQKEVERRFKEKNLTLLSSYEDKKTRVTIQCYCGTVFTAQPNAVFTGNTRSCGCYKQTIAKRTRRDISGQRFGQLVALEPTRVGEDEKLHWRCRCDCGTYTNVLLSNLMAGNTMSCGCGQRKTGKDRFGWKGCGEVPGNLWNRILWGANSRQLAVDVTIEDAWQLFLAQKRKCSIAGIVLRFGSQKLRVDTTASFDRIDSSQGYVFGNVQWIHKVINVMKSDLSQDRFIELCRLVAKPIESVRPSATCVVSKKHWNFKGHGNIGKDYWNRIRSGTRLGTDDRLRRDISFAITIEDAWRRFLNQSGRCALTGLELDWDYSIGSRGDQEHYRGSASLDRIDSKRGYETDNIQWVHKEVNRMKSDMDIAVFDKWCKLVARHSKK